MRLIEKLELWAQEANNALIISLREQKALQDKLTDLESRSRRNNLLYLRSYRGRRGAHRSLAQKPANGAQPRPIIVNFLEFNTKERVLREGIQAITDYKPSNSTPTVMNVSFLNELNDFYALF
ncbi:hypothetical protein L3Q82_009693 [Scortum barcoo]|uniref:Uncharacterized protein n=1 Tax=Scortum barcoo TaxID=214431 RepID=A0ACB8WDU9_9TELE|nr:hypothetical protein L3Q82_009693 [Scortum barcoo]